VAILFAWRLNVLSLGEKEARALGVNYKATMAVLIAVATLLTAGAVSVSGTIGWVGLVIPNIVRLFVGSDNRKVIPVSLLGGAAYMMIVDMLARSLAPNEIPLSVITGIIGTPLFLLSIFKRRKELL
jgi:iron complex transport system permease protein